jgi:hypothetical protein
MPGPAGTAAALPCIAVYAPRERVRTLARAAFPRRRARLVIVRTAAELAQTFHAGLVDAALIDLGSATDDAWAAAACARDFPSAPFFGVTPLRSADGATLAQCAALDFADVLVETVDDQAIRGLVLPLTFHSRFIAALREPPAGLGLATPLQRTTWTCVISHAGLPVRTDAVAESQTGDRSGAARGGRGAGEKSRLRHARRGERVVLRVAVASLEHHPAGAGVAAGIAGPAACGGSHRTFCRQQGPEPSGESCVAPGHRSPHARTDPASDALTIPGANVDAAVTTLPICSLDVPVSV